MKDRIAYFITGVIIFGVLTLIAGPVALYHGWALSILWGWFIVPTFGAPQLSLAQSVGLMVVVGFLFSGVAKVDTKDNAGGAIMLVLLSPLVSLLFGWIVTLWL